MLAAVQYPEGKDQRILTVDLSDTDGFVLTRKFYVQNGYDEEGQIPGFWAARDANVIFRKAL